MESRFLIKNTTKEQREEIVRNSLTCSKGTCDGCGSCDGVFGTSDPYDMYQPYIDGEKELSEITMEFNARYFVRDMGDPSVNNRSCGAEEF
jgi:hypothetical protein